MSDTFTTFSALLDDVWHALLRAARHGASAIARMSWPALLLCALLLAFVISLVPLALTLFVLFMLIKLAVGGIVIATRRARRDSFKD